jgi:tRNA(His) 5'-end guanylyltransferase
MSHTMLQLVKQVDGAVFAYQQSDEISIVLRNDQTNDTDPWFGNRPQKISSVAASIATYEFNHYFWNMPDPPKLEEPALFDARTFGIPNTSEVINYLVFRQQDCMRNAITAATYTCLNHKYGRRKMHQMLDGRSLSDRQDLLWDECGIDYHQDYPPAFRRGIAAYQAPRFVDTPHGQMTKHRWVLDLNLPRITDDRDFVHGILTTGRDIFRQDRDLNPTDISDESSKDNPI